MALHPHPNSALSGKSYDALYDDAFYRRQVAGSYLSAKKYMQILWPLLQPQAAIDVGCGRGAWLKALKERGASQLVGFDGDWNSQQNMIDPAITFHAGDLNAPFAAGFSQRFDLAISLEVAEHLEEASAAGFVRSLTALSDVVLFGAAYSGQGGTHHINEKPHHYWARLFESHQYLPFDLFRPIVWGDPEVEYWYQQNTFLYVRHHSDPFLKLVGAGQSPVKNSLFLNCLHPTLYELYVNKQPVEEAINECILNPLRQLKSRLMNLTSMKSLPVR